LEVEKPISQQYLWKLIVHDTLEDLYKTLFKILSGRVLSPRNEKENKEATVLAILPRAFAEVILLGCGKISDCFLMGGEIYRKFFLKMGWQNVTTAKIKILGVEEKLR